MEGHVPNPAETGGVSYSPTADLLGVLGIPADPEVCGHTDKICGPEIKAELENLRAFEPGTPEHDEYLGLLRDMANLGLNGQRPVS